jgi:hypothetical protein
MYTSFMFPEADKVFEATIVIKLAPSSSCNDIEFWNQKISPDIKKFKPMNFSEGECSF